MPLRFKASLYIYKLPTILIKLRELAHQYTNVKSNNKLQI